MSRMAGQFAGILRVAVPADAHAELTAALEGLQAQGIRVLLAHSGAEPTASWQEIQLELVGNDRPGIVRDITPPARRARRQSGEPGYRGAAGADEQRAAVSCRSTVGGAQRPVAERLQERLETPADDLMVELSCSRPSRRSTQPVLLRITRQASRLYTARPAQMQKNASWRSTGNGSPNSCTARISSSVGVRYCRKPSVE